MGETFKFSCVQNQKSRKKTWMKDERGVRKRDKRGRLRENSRAPSDGVTWRTKRREGKLTSYLQWCVFCWGLSLSRLCNRREKKYMSRASTAHTNTHMQLSWIKSDQTCQTTACITNCPTNKWGEIHPLDAPQCSPGARTKCALAVQWADTRPIDTVCPHHH